jgi:hypothetical protein
MPSLWTVTTTSDDHNDTGSLRYAIDNATPGDTIDFAPDIRAVELSSTLTVDDFAITNDQGVGTVTISAGGQFTVLDCSALASLSGLTIAGGTSINDAVDGGGIYNTGTLTASNCTFSNDEDVLSYFGAYGGGAIENNGTLTLNNCVFSNNDGGSGGAIQNNDSLTVSNCTFSGNSVGANLDYGGGAIYNAGTASVMGSSFSGNSAQAGQPGHVRAGGGAIDNGGTLTVTDSTFLENSASNGEGKAIALPRSPSNCSSAS